MSVNFKMGTLALMTWEYFTNAVSNFFKKVVILRNMQGSGLDNSSFYNVG